MGASVAYFASQRGWRVTVLEQSTVACAASGKAGGFLARQWGDGSATEGLHHHGYDLHKQLASTLKLSSYREVDTLSVEFGKAGKAPLPPWLMGEEGRKCRTRPMEGPTAQVTPKEITLALMQAAVSSGLVTLKEGVAAEGFCFNADSGALTGVRTAGGGLEPCTRAVVCMGPWSGWSGEWVGRPSPLPIEGLTSASLLYQPPGGAWLAAFESAPPTVLFCGDDRAGRGTHIEVYPRQGGRVYVCGLGGGERVGPGRLRGGGDKCKAELITPDPARVLAGEKTVEELLGLGSKPTAAQACLRPCAVDAIPLMGPLVGKGEGGKGRGVYMAAGHNCWGILWGPISGKLMVQLMAGEATDVDLGPFDPQRF